MARSGKYTDVPRSRASRSMGDPFAHVMRHVGDVYLQLEVTVLQPPHRHRIIEVARRLAVDGDDGQRPVVAPVHQLFRRNRPLKLLRLLQDFDGKLVRQMVLANDDLDIDAEIVLRSRGSPPLARCGLSAGEGQLVISTSTTRPSRLSHSRRCTSFPSTRSRLSAVGGCPVLSPSLGDTEGGYSIPLGITISLVTFSSIGVT